MSEAKRRPRPHASEPDEERRRSPRRPASMVPNLKARLLAGPDVRLLDISRRGVQLETDTRLLPGSPIRIKFVADDRNVIMKGCVVRSSVAVVSGTGLVYRTAVSFDEDIALCDASLWDEPAGAPAVQAHEPGQPQPSAAEPEAQTATVTTFFPSSSDELRALLGSNDW